MPSRLTNLKNYSEKVPNQQVDRQMQDSIQEFLAETKSIEDDLMKLKQLSIDKKHSELMISDP